MTDKSTHRQCYFIRKSTRTVHSHKQFCILNYSGGLYESKMFLQPLSPCIRLLHLMYKYMLFACPNESLVSTAASPSLLLLLLLRELHAAQVTKTALSQVRWWLKTKGNSSNAKSIYFHTSQIMILCNEAVTSPSPNCSKRKTKLLCLSHSTPLWWWQHLWKHQVSACFSLFRTGTICLIFTH